MAGNVLFEDKNLFKLYMDDISKYPLLSREEEDILSRKAIAGDKFAKERLINSNLKFVVSVAKQYQNLGISLMDLINEGNIGLINALEKFDPDRGYHFISYAVWWIRQSILKVLNEDSRPIRLPLNRANELSQIEKARKDLGISETTTESIKDISLMTNLDFDTVEKLLQVSQTSLSLDKPVKDEAGVKTILSDIIVDTNNSTPEEELLKGELKADINKFLSVLSEKEADVINKRFGLNGYKKMSLSEISKSYNLTKERIRQIEKRALENLKTSKHRALIETYVA